MVSQRTYQGGRPLSGAPPGRGPESVEAPSPTSRPRRRRAAAEALVAGLVVTVALSVAAWSINSDNENRLLGLQVNQTAVAIGAVLSTAQTPLVAAYEVYAATGRLGPFRSFVTPRIGAGQILVSVSLWHLGPGGPQLLTAVGPRPYLAGDPAAAARFFAGVHSSRQITLTPILPGDPPHVGFAEIPYQTSSPYVVYGEAALPPHRMISIPHNSAFGDLNFAAYLGRGEHPAQLLETSVALPITGRQARTTVPVGDTTITLVGTPVGPLGGALSENLWWIVLLAGVILSFGAAAVVDRLVQRRLVAETLAAENRRLYGQQRGIAQSLQHALLPQVLPVVPDVDVAVRYAPGVHGIDVGGDWYDLTRVDATRFFFAVGDVSGRGLEAAKTMASLRFALRAYAAQGDDPAVMLGRLSGLLAAETDGRFATVLAGVLDTSTGLVTLANAGHPPALLVGDATASFVAAPVGPPVGVYEHFEYRSVTVPFAAGATLLVFTDGLVERRDELIDVGLGRVRHAALAHRGPLDDLVSSLLEAADAGDVADDVAVLGLRCRG